MNPWLIKQMHFYFLFSDSGQNNSASSKSERLSAKLRALPGTDEPYESSSNKEIGKCWSPRPAPPAQLVWGRPGGGKCVLSWGTAENWHVQTGQTWKSVSVHSESWGLGGLSLDCFQVPCSSILMHDLFWNLDASYVDPLGPQIERPKTAAKKRIDEDDFADEELGDDLLPE